MEELLIFLGLQFSLSLGGQLALLAFVAVLKIAGHRWCLCILDVP
jgi:hypothetical protein